MEAVTRRRSQGKGSDDPSCLKEENNEFYTRLLRLTAEAMTDHGTQLKLQGHHDQCDSLVIIHQRVINLLNENAIYNDLIE